MTRPTDDEPSSQPVPPTAASPARDPDAAAHAARRRTRDRIRRVVLIALIVLGTLVDGFFALVNFYPVAPRRSRGPRRYVVVAATASEGAWLQRNILDEFNDSHETNLQVRIVADAGRVAAAMTSPDVVLAALPAVQAQAEADRGAVVPFDSVASPGRIQTDLAGLRPEVIAAARHRGHQFFLPRRVVVDVSVYRISRVRDAMLHWHLVQPAIEAALRAVNGRGLPADYELEQTPNYWDSYDLFVLAFYWAHRRYGGAGARPRVAHRTGLSADGQLEIVAGVYGAGAADANIRQHDSAPAVDWFQWEMLYRSLGLYPNAMFDADGLDDRGIERGISRGEIYFTTIDQMEAWRLHGGGHRDAPAGVDNEDDVGFVATPRFASLALDSDGQPTRERSKSFSFREDDVWVLPAHGAAPQTGYALVAWALAAENHSRECAALGAMPIREDTVRDRVSLFRSPWMLDAFVAGLAQWARSEPTAAALGAGQGIEYGLLWDTLVAQRSADAPMPTRDAVAAALRVPVDRAATARGSRDVRPEPNSTEPSWRAFAVPPLRDNVDLDWRADAGADAGADAAPTDARGDR